MGGNKNRYSIKSFINLWNVSDALILGSDVEDGSGSFFIFNPLLVPKPEMNPGNKMVKLVKEMTSLFRRCRWGS